MCNFRIITGIHNHNENDYTPPTTHTHTHTECHLGTDDLWILLHVSKCCQWQAPVCHYREEYTTVHSHTIYGYMVGYDL